MNISDRMILSRPSMDLVIALLESNLEPPNRHILLRLISALSVSAQLSTSTANKCIWANREMLKPVNSNTQKWSWFRRYAASFCVEVRNKIVEMKPTLQILSAMDTSTLWMTSPTLVESLQHVFIKKIAVFSGRKQSSETLSGISIVDTAGKIRTFRRYCRKDPIKIDSLVCLGVIKVKCGSQVCLRVFVALFNLD